MSDTLTRRLFLSAAALAASPLYAQTTPFSKETALNAMRETAKNAFAPPPSTRVLANIAPDAYAGIKYNAPSFITPLHQGGFFQTPTRIHIVENGVAREIIYEAGKFDGLPAQEQGATFSGFSYAQDGEELVRFQAGTTFRVKGFSQVFGALARALVLNVAEPTGEEFPGFRHYWIVKPANALEPLVIYGLFTSESVTGLACFSMKPGNITTVEVEITFIPRVDLTHVGFAPMNAMYLFGLNDKANADDVRGAVHDVTGVSMITGAGEAIYRPVHNPDTLQISSFIDMNPKGFGLSQLERRFDLFQDLDGQFERRPSLWVEPIGEWGEGAVQLVEIPSESQSNKNILCYWRPKRVFKAAGEVTIAYRMTAGWGGDIGILSFSVSSIRSGKGTLKRRRFIVDFQGVAVDSESKLSTTTPMLSNRGGKLYNISMRFNPETKGARVSFELDPEGLSACELRLVLEADKKPVSETLLYRWTP
jgi:periplasmic glucans biosynthesis protein